MNQSIDAPMAWLHYLLLLGHGVNGAEGGMCVCVLACHGWLSRGEALGSGGGGGGGGGGTS